MSEEKKETSLIESAEEFLEAKPASYVDVDISEWVEGKSIRIRSLSANEALSFVDTHERQDKKETQEEMIKLVAQCAIDKDGNGLFTEEQVEKLKTKSFGMFVKIQKEAMKLNRLSVEEGEKTPNEEEKKDSNENQ
jgi:hypothetical protein